MIKHKGKTLPSLFELVRAELRGMDWNDLEELAAKCDLTAAALWFWQNDVTESPRIHNVERVLEALGYTINIQ